MFQQFLQHILGVAKRSKVKLLYLKVDRCSNKMTNLLKIYDVFSV